VARDAPHVATIFWPYFAVLIGVSIFSYIQLGEKRLDLHLLFNDLAIFVTTCVVGLIYRKSLAAQLARFGFDRPEAWLGLMLLVPTLGLNYMYHEMFLRSLL